VFLHKVFIGLGAVVLQENGLLAVEAGIIGPTKKGVFVRNRLSENSGSQDRVAPRGGRQRLRMLGPIMISFSDIRSETLAFI
jgi:hypothetical protein